jgi:hypothetical protein
MTNCYLDSTLNIPCELQFSFQVIPFLKFIDEGVTTDPEPEEVQS